MKISLIGIDFFYSNLGKNPSMNDSYNAKLTQWTDNNGNKKVILAAGSKIRKDISKSCAENVYNRIKAERDNFASVLDKDLITSRPLVFESFNQACQFVSGHHVNVYTALVDSKNIPMLAYNDDIKDIMARYKWFLIHKHPDGRVSILGCDKNGFYLTKGSWTKTKGFLEEDLYVKSPSSAATVVSGTCKNAYLYWKTIGGDKLDDARKLMNAVA